MDFTTAVKIIMRDLEETREIIDDIAASSDTHAPELELARARLRSASETLSLLPRLMPQASAAAQQPVQVQRQTPADAVTQKPVAPAEEKREPSPAAGKAEEPVKESAPVSQPEEPVLEIEPEEVKEELRDKTGTKKPDEARKEAEQPAKPILADKFSTEGVLGEKIATQKNEGDIAAAIGSKPISDITSAIGINDRFYFIRELFGNNPEDYSRTLSRLNKASSFGEAVTILDNSVVSSPPSEAYSSFTDIIKRKFPVA